MARNRAAPLRAAPGFRWWRRGVRSPTPTRPPDSPAHIETLCPEGLAYIFRPRPRGCCDGAGAHGGGLCRRGLRRPPRHTDPQWVPGVYDRRLVDYKNLSKQCPIGPRDLVVVATAGHKSDIDVVIQAMRASPPIRGCLGLASQDGLRARPPGAGGLYAGAD